ncbi:MAG: peptidylprolyl isomerase [Myxococcota bacterium]
MNRPFFSTVHAIVVNAVAAASVACVGVGAVLVISGCPSAGPSASAPASPTADEVATPVQAEAPEVPEEPTEPEEEIVAGPTGPAPEGLVGEGEPAPALLDPEQATATAPERFRVAFETSRGRIVIEVDRSWAPRGADRFYNLVTSGFYDGAVFYRVVKGFMAQCGLSPAPRVNQVWARATIADDPRVLSNVRGTVTFAQDKADSRRTQFFINYADRNRYLDEQGFVPFGKVISGMNVAEALENKYGEQVMGNHEELYLEGNAFLNQRFPGLDYIERAQVLE